MNASNAKLSEAAGPASNRRAAFYRFFNDAPEPRTTASLGEAPARAEAAPATGPDAGPPAPDLRSGLPRSRPAVDETPDPPTSNDPPATPGSRVPHFADVPDAAKHPAGPYVQAPEEFGGEWWLVNPFVGTEPWVTAMIELPDSAAPEDLPENFTRIFGQRPEPRAGESHSEFQARSMDWQQNLDHFKGAGFPDGFDPDDIELASATYEAWGMGEPQFYEGRYGPRVRFPDSQIPEFEFNVQAAINVPHIVIARYQVRQFREGTTPTTPHPFLPVGLREDPLPVVS